MNAINHSKNTSHILVTMACFVIVVAGMSAAKVIVVPFLLAAFIAIIVAPPLFWLQRKGLPTLIALLIVVLGVLLVGLLISYLIGSSVNDFSDNLPAYQARLEQQTSSVINLLEKHGVDTSGLSLTEVFNPGTIMRLVATSLNSLGSMLTNGFLILMTVVFILLEASGFPAKLRAVMGGAGSSSVNLNSFVGNVQHYMAIKSLTSLGTGILVVVLLTISGVDYPLLWGLLAFVLNFVPNIGSIIAAIPAVLLTIVQFGLARAGVVAAGYLVINVLVGNILEPRFMGRGLGLSTLVVFISLVFWGWVLGPVGMLLSVPLTVTVKIALDSRDDTRWIAVLLGPEVVSETK